MRTIKTVDGEEVSDERVKLAMYIIQNDLAGIVLEYSGSGDSGDSSCFSFKKDKDGKYIDKKPLTDIDIDSAASNIAFEIVNPNFNDSGSYGEATFTITADGKLNMSCEHHDIIETTDDTNYDEDILDTTML